MKEVGHELNSAEKNLIKNPSLYFIITNNFIIFVPMIDIVQIIGLAFVGIIMVCIAWTIVEYITNSLDGPNKRNQKLLDRVEKLMKKKRQ